MKKFLILLQVLLAFSATSQNKQILYNFAELPQTLLLNPAAETNYKFHVGVPFLSGFSAQIGSKGVVLKDIFAVDNRNINDKIVEAISNLRPNDYLKLNTQVEILSGGFRYKDKTYISFGFYEEIDAFGYFPKDLLTLLTEGNNAFLNKNFRVSEISYQLDVLGVLHAGFSKKIDEQLTLGARVKLYSSALNMQSTYNTGTFTTTEGVNSLYTHYLNNIHLNARTSGLVNSETNQYIEDTSQYLKNTFLGDNIGVGFDVGFTYKMSPQLEISGSILDVGFINHKTNIKNSKVEGDFVYEGVIFTFDANTPRNYWGEIDKRLKEQLPITEDQESYISWRPTKINAALKYSFGERRSKVCYDNRFKDFYTDALGFQLHTVFRPLNPQLAFTGFYQKSITNKIHTKFTYTIDDVSFTNFGAGVSAQIGSVNFYGMVDNLLSYRNLSAANSLSLQVGFNVIFN
ncbi:DUF5723 family protein [Polaribacter sp. Hel_I_88]|uniref:DUF5723 family protein n=1 Tax=Polaribacter sp. Hel_I_88 TaxID=1250006 RepID=UPI00047CD4FC|nr:DUF5723 family protein [Polaribacter sp. Hel_I_88]